MRIQASPTADRLIIRVRNCIIMNGHTILVLHCERTEPSTAANAARRLRLGINMAAKCVSLVFGRIMITFFYLDVKVHVTITVPARAHEIITQCRVRDLGARSVRYAPRKRQNSLSAIRTQKDHGDNNDSAINLN